jgi:hypothetical protein
MEAGNWVMAAGSAEAVRIAPLAEPEVVAGAGEPAVTLDFELLEQAVTPISTAAAPRAQRRQPVRVIPSSVPAQWRTCCQVDGPVRASVESLSPPVRASVESLSLLVHLKRRNGVIL